jgi:hypothetical protein
MQRRSTILVLAVAAALSLGGESRAESVAEAFEGTWELVSFELFSADGETTSRNMSGRIHYSPGGYMAAQLMPLGRDAPAADASADERWAAARGYVAYFGRYEIDEDAGAVTHRVAGSVNQSWVGRGLVRYYDLDDDILKLSLKDDQGRISGTLTWRRQKTTR